MTQYLKITKKELIALIEVVDSAVAMADYDNEDFYKEAHKGRRAINSILKRSGLAADDRPQNVTVKIGNIR